MKKVSVPAFFAGLPLLYPFVFFKGFNNLEKPPFTNRGVENTLNSENSFIFQGKINNLKQFILI